MLIYGHWGSAWIDFIESVCYYDYKHGFGVVAMASTWRDTFQSTAVSSINYYISGLLSFSETLKNTLFTHRKMQVPTFKFIS